MLAGNRRGTVIPLKEPKGQREWVTRQVHAYSARLFSAIGLPDDVLGSRAITVPLVRSLDDQKAKIDPLDHAAWPHHRQQLIDDLWATGLSNLLTVHEYDAKAADRARLIGRDLDPWRGILAVALWLQEECGVAGLFGRMEALSVRYQDERGELEAGDDTRLLILALRDVLGENEEVEFETSVLCKAMNQLAQEAEVAGQWGEGYTNPKRVGRLLQRLRFTKAQRTSEHKRWKITRDELSGLSRSYGLEVRSHKENGTNGIMAPSGVPRCQECQVPGDNGSPEAARLNQAVATVEQGLEALKDALRTAAPVS